MNKSSLHF